jgi:peptide/nickel transport system substrate-binding protein
MFIDRVRSRWFGPAVLTVAIPILIVGCSSAPEVSQDASSASQVASSAPSASSVDPVMGKDAVTVAIGEVFQQNYSIDPYARPTSGEMMPVLNSTYERLVDMTPDGVLVPKLAESWSADASGTEWTFKLRPGVTFHDGTPFTAEDVVWSFRQMLDPANAYAVTEQFGAFLDTDSVQALDAQTVTIRATRPTVDLPNQISYMEAVMVKNGSTAEERSARENGTGPYTAPDWTQGSKKVTLRAFPGYWQEGLPKTKEIHLVEVTDSTARMVALQNGEADIVMKTDLATIPTIQGDSALQLLQSAPALFLDLEMRVTQPPFDNPNVRKALKLVLDRQSLAENVYLGTAVAGTDQPIPPTSVLAWSDTFTGQDIEQARALLAEAGYDDSNPLVVELFAGEVEPGAMRIAQAFQADAAKAGVTVNLREVPQDQYWDSVWMKKPFYLDAWGVRPPNQALPFAYGCEPTYDVTGWCNEEYEELMKQASETLDEAARNELYKAAQQLIHEDGGTISGVFKNSVDAARATCQGYAPPVPFYQVDFTQLVCS